MNGSGVTQHNTVGWNIKIDKSTGEDHHIITDSDFSNHRCIDSNKDPVSYDLGTRSFSTVFYTVVDIQIVPNYYAVTS